MPSKARYEPAVSGSTGMPEAYPPGGFARGRNWDFGCWSEKQVEFVLAEYYRLYGRVPVVFPAKGWTHFVENVDDAVRRRLSDADRATYDERVSGLG